MVNTDETILWSQDHHNWGLNWVKEHKEVPLIQAFLGDTCIPLNFNYFKEWWFLTFPPAQNSLWSTYWCDILPTRKLHVYVPQILQIQHVQNGLQHNLSKPTVPYAFLALIHGVTDFPKFPNKKTWLLSLALLSPI